jgi:hypothetical protein
MVEAGDELKRNVEVGELGWRGVGMSEKKGVHDDPILPSDGFIVIAVHISDVLPVRVRAWFDRESVLLPVS